MRAILFAAPREFALTEVPDPEPGPYGVVIRVEACGTDVHVLGGKFEPTVFPGEATRPGGWEVVIGCTGVVAAIEDGLPGVRRGGRFQQFGVAPGEARASISPFRVYNDEIAIVGSMAALHSYGRAVEMFATGVIDAAPMVSHAFTLDDYGTAIKTLRAGTGRKRQIRPRSSTSTDLQAPATTKLLV